MHENKNKLSTSSNISLFDLCYEFIPIFILPLPLNDEYISHYQYIIIKGRSPFYYETGTTCLKDEVLYFQEGGVRRECIFNSSAF
jgi:hypothetical protein